MKNNTLLMEFDSKMNFDAKWFSLILNTGKSMYTRVRNEKRVKMVLVDPYYILKERNEKSAITGI